MTLSTICDILHNQENFKAVFNLDVSPTPNIIENKTKIPSEASKNIPMRSPPIEQKIARISKSPNLSAITPAIRFVFDTYLSVTKTLIKSPDFAGAKIFAENAIITALRALWRLILQSRALSIVFHRAAPINGIKVVKIIPERANLRSADNNASRAKSQSIILLKLQKIIKATMHAKIKRKLIFYNYKLLF
tara:strand:- start:2429 stop:3001 length:573 start_codon:yes stop_codon:yes gene_type:complete